MNQSIEKSKIRVYRCQQYKFRRCSNTATWRCGTWWYCEDHAKSIFPYEVYLSKEGLWWFGTVSETGLVEVTINETKEENIVAIENIKCLVKAQSGLSKNCLIYHKVQTDQYKVGDNWVCPTCNTKYVRVDNHINVSGKSKHFTWITV